MNIYLHVEISARELDSKLLLAVLAASKGHEVVVAGFGEIINGIKITKNIDADNALTVDHVDGPYNSDETLKRMINERGFEA